jgi:hypothetical protein
MAQTYPLDPVIRIVAEKEAIRSLDKVLVVIEASSGRAVEKIEIGGGSQLYNQGFIGRILQERKYFLVSNEYDPRNEVEASVPGVAVRDFGNNWSLPLAVNYLVRCRQGNEVRVAEALWAGSHPGAVLHDAINRWVKEFSGPQTANLIQNFYGKQHELEGYLEQKADDELGLTLQATVRIDSRAEPTEQIKIGPVHVPVRVKEDTVDQDLKFEARLSVDPQKKMSAILYRDREAGLGDLLKIEIQKYCLSNVSLQSLYFNAPGKLEEDLAAYLNNVVRPYGRVLSFFSVQLTGQRTGQLTPESFFETKKAVPYEIAGENVKIMNHVQMSLQDYGLYNRTGAEDLDSWLERNLEEIIHQVLFGKQHIDLLIGFDPLKEEIKRRLGARANSIGYSIKQLITVPNLEQYAWLENFPLELDEFFQTKTPRFPVHLGIHVVSRIQRLQDVGTYLNQRKNVPDEMKTIIREQTRQALHAVDPERFYMQFSYAEVGLSVEDELRERITTSLTAKFKADVISIVFQMLDTDMTDIWEKLEKSEGDLEIVFPSYSEATENLIYRATLRIEAIHQKGWQRFRTANKELPNLCRRLQEHIVSRLAVFANDQLIFTNLEGQQRAEYHLDRIAKKFAFDEFGLVIRLNSLRREVTSTERLQKDVISKTREAIATLEKRIVDEILVEARPEKITAFQEQIKLLTETLPAGVKATRANFNRPSELQAAPPSQLPEPPLRKAIGRGAQAENNGHKES